MDQDGVQINSVKIHSEIFNRISLVRFQLQGCIITYTDGKSRPTLIFPRYFFENLKKVVER